MNTVAKSGYGPYERRLGNWILAIAKISIVHSRFNKAKDKGTHCAVTLFKAKLISRISIEYQFAKFHGNVHDFGFRWNINNSLCRVGIEFEF